jgi:hypothetical protein
MVPISLHTTELRLVTLNGEVTIHQTIREVLESLLPEGWSYTDSWFNLNKAKWQGMLATGLRIPKNNTYNELFWPNLANTLIGYLLVRDLITQSLNQMLLSVGSGGSTKSIKTGPTEVQYHDMGRVLQNLFSKGGLFELYQTQLCSIARVLKIHINGCDPNTPMPPRVLYSTSKAYINPYTEFNK